MHVFTTLLFLSVDKEGKVGKDPTLLSDSFHKNYPLEYFRIANSLKLLF